MPNIRARTPKPRSRTFTGCLACRSRKVKCDLGRPGCANCQRLGLGCPGYGAVLSWMPPWAPSREDQAGTTACPEEYGLRRPRAELLSEHERKTETERLLKHLTRDPTCSDIDNLLYRLDQRASSEDSRLANKIGFQVEVGPYSVFSSSKTTSVDTRLPDLTEMTYAPPLEDSIAPCPPFHSDQDLPFAYSYDRGQRLQSTCVPVETDFGGAGEMALDPGDTSCFVETSWLDSHSVNLSGFLMQSNGSLQSSTPMVAQASSDDTTESPVPPGSPTTYLSAGSPYLPAEVRFLLHHYDSRVIDSLSAMPLPHEEAPWRGLHLPSALRAYGELDVFGTSGLARVSLLYSLLSLTCYHISSLYSSVHTSSGSDSRAESTFQSTPSTAHWKTQAHKFRGIARTAFRKHIESKTFETQKYKESLMAGMTLVCVGIVSGDPWDARLYLRQCETIIRIGAERKQKFSKRALQLHHMFAFIRIMEQSTFCNSQNDYINLLENHDSCPSEVNLIKDIPSSQDGLAVYHSVTPHTQSAASHLQLELPEDEGFHRLFGTCSKLLKMLAETNALIDRMTSHASSNSCSRYVLPVDLLGTAAGLEQSICDWANDSDSSPNTLGLMDLSIDQDFDVIDLATDAANDSTSTMVNCMRVAFYYALLVYFFREVRNTNPKILQHYVRKVIACLEWHQAVKTQFYPSKLIGTIVWPGFIVACEALSPNLRHRAIACIRHSVAAGFGNGEVAESVVKEVWRRRDTGDGNISWRDVVRQMKVFMLLS